MSEHKLRVQKALDHEEPDRVPFDFWAAPEVYSALQKQLNARDADGVLELFDIDFRYVQGPSYTGQEMRVFGDGTVEDLWGVKRKSMTVRTAGTSWKYKHVVESPLAQAASVRDIEQYSRWPSADMWDYSGLQQQCRKYSDYVTVNCGDRLDRTAQLKPAMYLRGTEQIFIDILQNPEIAEAIFDRITSYFLEYNRRVFESAGGLIDIFMMGDDFGTQNGLMIDRKRWRRFFYPGLEKYIALAHKYDIKVMHHTCGSIRELVPDFIDAGLDILQSLQPAAVDMDLGELKKEYGKDISLHGSIDIQHVLPHGKPADVRKEVAGRMAAGKPGGGFIICTAHNIQPDVPLENIIALVDAYREFGYY